MDTFNIVLYIFAVGITLLAIYQLIKFLYEVFKFISPKIRLQKEFYPASTKLEVLGISPRQIFTVQRIGFMLFLLSMAIAISGYAREDSKSLSLLAEDFYANVATELASIALTVLIIDRIYESQANRQLKMQLFREMSSRDNGIALRAISELRAHGWLEDGSLRGIRLENANLQNANLSGADLRKAYFYQTNLSRANLANANLQSATLIATDLDGANLAKANLDDINSHFGDQRLVNLLDDTLKHAYRLVGATMPDGSKYNGRFNLEGDFYIVNEWSSSPKLDINSHEDMSKFYGVSLEKYVQGQEWARKNLKVKNKRDKNFSQQTVIIRKSANNGVLYKDDSEKCVLSTDHSATAEAAL
jgi:uncharacterized protein YjbI with pentapeptide repeats